jgi:uncharacterized protein (TIGR03437 family)
MRKIAFLLFFVLAAVAATAAPRVNTGGVVNGASYVPAALPHGGVAQGSIFSVFGMGLGPESTAHATSFPLSTQLANTTVQVTSGGISTNAFLLFTKSTQIGAVLPSTIPTGSASLTVTYNGETSAPVSFEIVQSTFGIFTANAAGSGPAAAQNYNPSSGHPFNSVHRPARPGQIVTLWGTGLGPIVGEDNQPPLSANLSGDVKVFVAGEPAQVQYRGRTPCCAGEDQINFVVPQGIEGCYVPVWVELNGVPSNYATIAITANGNACHDPNGLTSNDMERLAAGGNMKAGIITLWSGFAFAEPSEVSAEFGFWSAAYALHINARAAAGHCVANAGATIGFPGGPPVDGPLLDAGPNLTISGPGGTTQMGPGFFYQYEAVFLGTNFFVPGNSYTVSGTGGADVGPFQATMVVPPSAFTWTNQNAIQNIPRNQDLLITWSGGDPNSLVVINGYADRVSFQCTALASAGQFTVPAPILSFLPPTSPNSYGQLEVRHIVRARFQASGLDFGFIEFPTYFYASVNYQ